MKRTIFILSTALLLALSATSCKRCVVCTSDNGDKTKFCSEDKERRDNFVQGASILGGTCKDAI